MLLAGICGLAFLTVVVLVLSLAQPLARMGELARRGDTAPNLLTDSPAGPLIRLLGVLLRRPGLEERASSIERQLVEAGQPGGAISGWDFLAAALLLGAGSFVLLLALMSVAWGSLGLVPIVFGAVTSGLSVFILFAWLDGAVESRRRSIARQLPFFLDLAVMCMEAGASFPETVEIYEQDNSDDDLAAEFRITMSETRMGKTLGEALHSLIERINVETLHNVMNALIQAERMGTPLGQTLREQAEMMRFKRSQEAERIGEELKVAMQGPTMLMMVAVFLLILGPAFLETLNSGIM